MSLQIHTARRAPRLPRDHFTTRPQLTRAQRIARAIVIGLVVVYYVSLKLFGHG